MPERQAVCYAASGGYLLQTVLSAVQARQHTPRSVPVVVAHLRQEGSDAAAPFRRVLEDAGVDLIEAPVGLLGDLHFAFARLFLPDILPREITDVLYLDGDTQIVGDLAPLLHLAPPKDGLIAVKDPMVFIHGTTPSFHRKVESWWEESGIPPAVRERYVNSGVLRIRRDTLLDLRLEVQALLRADGRHARFLDQDLINRAMGDRVATVGLDWNFPGFLLGTRVETGSSPRIIHFMSDPRPWQAPFRPWGAKYFEPYARLVARYPELEPVWRRASSLQRARYGAQQVFKHLTERRTWQSERFVRAIEETSRGDLTAD